MELNQSVGIVKAKRLMTKSERVLETNSDDQNGMSRAKTKPRFTPKNGSTGIPTKRRLVKTYEARVRFGTRVWVQVRVRDSAIFENVGCGCGGTRRLKNY